MSETGPRLLPATESLLTKDVKHLIEQLADILEDPESSLSSKSRNYQRYYSELIDRIEPLTDQQKDKIVHEVFLDLQSLGYHYDDETRKLSLIAKFKTHTELELAMKAINDKEESGGPWYPLKDLISKFRRSSERPVDLSRRKALGQMALGATGLGVGGMLINHLTKSGERLRAHAQELMNNIVIPRADRNFDEFEAEREKEQYETLTYPEGINLEKVYENMPHIKQINKATNFIYQFSPGGYSENLSNRALDNLGVDNEGERSRKRNNRGQDMRSRLECYMVESYVNIMSNSGAPNSELLKEDISSLGLELPLTDLQPNGMPTYGDIMHLYQVCTSRTARIKLRDKCWDMQQSGELTTYGLKPLSDEKIAWAESKNVHPFTLANAESVYGLAEMILTYDQDTWFDGYGPKYKQRALERIKEHGISNPGIIATMEHTETNGTVYIGDAPVLTQLNSVSKLFSSSEENLKAIAFELQENWGIPYESVITIVEDPTSEERMLIESLAGSLRGSPEANISGSAVFGQLMIPMLFRFICPHYINGKLVPGMWEQTRMKMEKHGVDLPALAPGAPWAMSLVKYLWINGYWKAIEGVPGKEGHHGYEIIGAKGGYVPGNRPSMTRAIRGWFGSLLGGGRQNVIPNGVSYYQEFQKEPMIASNN